MGLIIMKKTTLYTAIVGSILSASVVHAAPTFDGNVELNTDAIATSESADKSTEAKTIFKQDGRVELNTHGKHTSGDNFIEGKATIALKTNGATGVDDSYVKIGGKSWDVQLGNFEGMDLFPKGKDTVLEHAGNVGVYSASEARGRAGGNGGQIALHFKASDSLSFELGTVLAQGDKETAFSGVRPVIEFKAGSATFRAGYESIKYDKDATTEVSQTGYGLTAGFNVAGANINISVAQLDDDISKEEVSSFGVNMTHGNFGLGVISSTEDNATGDDPSVMSTYVAYSMPIFDIENATLTLASSFSTADDVEATKSDETVATRVRVNYTF